MKNDFAREYEALQELKAAYHAAETEEAKEAVRQDRKRWGLGMELKGEAYIRVFNLYEHARDRGNEYIDLHDCIWDKDVKPLIDSLRANGIEKFTFSSTWSSAVETAWLFLQNGCRLEGLVELDGTCKKTFGDGYEKAHGYLFSIG